MDRRRALLHLAAAAAAMVPVPYAATAAAAPPAGARKEPPMQPLLARPIPSTGRSLPVIGLGTWQTFDVGPSPAERAQLREVLRLFVELGGSLVDSSPMYGRSEEVVGDLAAELGARPRLFMATKVWTQGKAEGIRQMEDSLRKLRADPIDLMQVHNLLDWEAHLETLAEWKRKGRAAHVGITHYAAGAHDRVARVLEARPLDFVQINYSVGEREAERRLLPLAREKGVAVIANRPFAGGDLLRRLKGKPLPGFAAEAGCSSWAQLLLKWVVGHPAVTCAIPATSKAAHLRDNMAAGRGPLPDEGLRARIAAAAREG